MAQVIPLRPDEVYSADTDHLLIEEVRRHSGERLVGISGTVRMPGELEPAGINFGSKPVTVEAAIDEAKEYADAKATCLIGATLAMYARGTG